MSSNIPRSSKPVECAGIESERNEHSGAECKIDEVKHDQTPFCSNVCLRAGP